MADINKDMTIAELIEKAPDKVDVLLMAGMHCVGCPASLGETIEEACMVHGIDVEDLLKELNREGNRFEEAESESEEN